MTRNDPPPEIREALLPLVQWFVLLVVETAAKHVQHDDAPEFVDVKTAAKLFCLAPTTVERWIKERRLTAHRAGKKLVIKTSDVRAIVEAQGPARGGKARAPRAPVVVASIDPNDLTPAQIAELSITRPLSHRRGK